MNKFKIFVDSGSDITDEKIERLKIDGVPKLTFNMEGVEYSGFNKEQNMMAENFYAKLKEGAVAITSQVNVSVFEEYFDKALSEGNDVLYIGISSALSGTVQSASIARDMLLEKYPDRNIVIVDSLSASVGMEILAEKASNMRDDGATMEEIEEELDELKMKVCHFVVVDDLMFLERGGRLSKVSAVAGSLLNLKPIIVITDEGKLEPTEKVRGMKKTFKVLLEKLKTDKELFSDSKVYIGHADALDEAEEFKAMIEEENMSVKPEIFELGPVLGAHVGPGTIVCAYTSDKRVK